MTSTSWSQVVRSEVWTFTPSCSTKPTAQPTQNSAPGSSFTRAASDPTAVSSGTTSTRRGAQPIETAFMQGGSSEVSTSPTLIIVTTEPQSPGQLTDASLLSAIETASNLGSMGHAGTETLQTTPTLSGSIESLSSASDDKISTDLILTASRAATQTETAAVATSTADEGKSGNEVAGIVAGTLGAIAAILLLVVAWVWWRRKQRDKENTLIFAPNMHSPAVAEQDDYPHSITSVSEVSQLWPLLTNLFAEHEHTYRDLSWYRDSATVVPVCREANRRICLAGGGQERGSDRSLALGSLHLSHHRFHLFHLSHLSHLGSGTYPSMRVVTKITSTITAGQSHLSIRSSCSERRWRPTNLGCYSELGRG
jgi:hypothetical protein